MAEKGLWSTFLSAGGLVTAHKNTFPRSSILSGCREMISAPLSRKSLVSNMPRNSLSPRALLARLIYIDGISGIEVVLAMPSRVYNPSLFLDFMEVVHPWAD